MVGILSFYETCLTHCTFVFFTFLLHFYGNFLKEWRTWSVYIILQNNVEIISLVSYINIILIYNMPKTEIDYSNTIFYKIHCNNPDVKDVYIGHTTNFVQRKHSHKRSCTHDKSANYNCKVYNVIREYGGWDNWKMEIIAFHECADHYAARKIEQKYFEEYKATLNSLEPFPKPKVTPSKETLPKAEKQFLYCERCDVYFSTVTAHNIHNKTNKHIKMVAKNAANENPNITHDKYNCTTCSFNTCNKKDYNRHILSAKHLRLINTNNESVLQLNVHTCICGNEYKHAPSLSKHKKSCTYTQPPTENTIIYTIEEPAKGEVHELRAMIVDLLKHNGEMHTMIREMIPHIGNNPTINTQLNHDNYPTII
jgi:hypothetical protein